MRWTQRRKLNQHDLTVWNNLILIHDGLKKKVPTSVKSCMVSGYKFFLADDTVTAYHQPWTNTLRVTETTLPRCAYCHKIKVLTKEHVIPKSMGGTYTIGVCKTCNQEREVSFDYQPFKDWVHENWDSFIEAVKAVDTSNMSEEQKEVLITELKRLGTHSEKQNELNIELKRLSTIHLRL